MRQRLKGYLFHLINNQSTDDKQKLKTFNRYKSEKFLGSAKSKEKWENKTIY